MKAPSRSKVPVWLLLVAIVGASAIIWALVPRSSKRQQADSESETSEATPASPNARSHDAISSTQVSGAPNAMSRRASMIGLVVSVLVFALINVRKSTAGPLEFALFAGFTLACFSVDIREGVWTARSLRMFADAYVMAMVVLLATRRRLVYLFAPAQAAGLGKDMADLFPAVVPEL